MKCKHGIPHGHDCCSICLGHKPSIIKGRGGGAKLELIWSVEAGYTYFQQERNSMGDFMEINYDYGGADPYGI